MKNTKIIHVYSTFHVQPILTPVMNILCKKFPCQS